MLACQEDGKVHAPLSRDEPRQLRRAARKGRRPPGHQRGHDDRLRRSRPKRAGRELRHPGRSGLRAGRPRGRDGLPHLGRDPELLEIRAKLRPAGPHVPVGSVVEPALASLHGLRLVGSVLETERPDELRQPGSEPPHAARVGRPERQAPGRASLRVDGHHVPASPGRRELGLLRLPGHPTRLRRRQGDLQGLTAKRADPRHLESAPVLRHRATGRRVEEHPAHRELLRRCEDRDASGRLVGHAGRLGERAPALERRRGRELRDRSDQHDHEGAELELDGNLPRLGRLGRLLRPRSTAESRPERLRPSCAWSS